MTTIIEHLESNLARMEQGWSAPEGPEGIQIGLFRDQPVQSICTLATIGLSRHVLSLPGGRSVRQELLLSVHERQFSDDLASLLLYVAERLVARHDAVLRGEVVPLGAPMTPRSRATDLYVSLPVVFPEGLATFNRSSPATVIAWLFPVLPDEVQFIALQGWSAFEDLLECRDPDLFDPFRMSILVSKEG